MHNPAVTNVPINEAIANRRSGRAYAAGKPVSRDQIIALLEAARWAPSCYGDQPWRFVVCDKNADKSAWRRVFDCLSPSNQNWAQNASLLVLLCTDTVFTHNQQPNRWAQYDAGAAAENLCLQASSMGLMSHQMGGFDAEKVRGMLAIPARYDLMTVIAVGYAAELADLTGDVLTRETASRSRRPLGELFFAGSWGEPVV